jgi:conjugative relaxase-like TrwC/TraI family protein
LIDRRHPASGQPLGGAKRPTVRAIDATFSAPKSVSLVWAFAGSEVASVVSIAHVEAVEAALGFVESHAAVTRRQVKGVRVRAGSSGWAAATFVHRTSRSGDPQIHTHAVIPNVVRRDDGMWVALDAMGLYRWAKAAGCVYQEELRRRLSERLGVAWGPDRNGCREMTGISEAQLRMFSKRSVDIEEHLAREGFVSGDAEARMRADEAASLATRPAKDRTLTPPRLRARWEAEAEQAGLAVGDALIDTVRADRPPSARVSRTELRELFDRLVDPEVGLCAHDSRFGQAQVIEAVAAWGAGRLGVGDIETLAGWFLGSDRVVRLVNPDSSGRAPGQWSTVAHRRVEDRVIDHLQLLQNRDTAGVDPADVAAAMATASGLGADQATAVSLLCRPGVALRALISPAGYGKTTTLATAVDTIRRAGRPVIALSTTNQAVDQLRQLGIPAVTVARFALDDTVLEAGSVVVVDEFSQLPTREAHTVLAAAAACPDSMVWMVGDPLQAQPVGAGGLANWLAEQTATGRVAVAELTVNRRQADPIERQALSEFRAGHVVDSQELRDRAGWEHHHSDRDQALDAMAAAILADLQAHPSERVAALGVTHADCEALADRIRAGLADKERIGGPVLEGPGWSGPRCYQAGDRILLHAHADLANGHRLTNGIVVTVTEVTPDGLAVTADRTLMPVLLPREFVSGRAGDGRPQVSHGWARTIDGVQGGTWDQVHLLATPALDRYRGYVGQSRSIQPTHTWNTTPAPHPDAEDHGGRLVRPTYTTAEQIATALARAQPKTFAAVDDPYRLERHIRAEQAAHRTHLETRPPDMSRQIHNAKQVVAARQRDLDDTQARLAHWQAQHRATAGLGSLRPSRRDQHHHAGRQIEFLTSVAETGRQHLDQAHKEHQELLQRQTDGDAFDQANTWRHQRIRDLQHALERHWAQAVLDAAKDGHPGAYGAARLQAARHTIIEQVEHLADLPAPPPDRHPTTPLDDPLQALADLDQAIRQAADHPGPRPVQTRRAARPDHHSVPVQHQHLVHADHHPTAPSAGIQL